MDYAELQALVAREVKKMMAQWKKLPALVEAGKLVKTSGNWYRIKDHEAVKQIGAIAKGLRMAKGGVTHIQIPKPTKKFLALADSLARKE